MEWVGDERGKMAEGVGLAVPTNCFRLREDKYNLPGHERGKFCMNEF